MMQDGQLQSNHKRSLGSRRLLPIRFPTFPRINHEADQSLDRCPRLPAGKSDHIEWDTTLPGFGVRVRTSGKRTFIVQYRVGHAQRRETLGDVRELDLEQARRAAKRKLGAVALGHDPAAEKAEARARAKHTLGAVLPRFIERQRARVRPRSMPALELHLLRRWAPLHGLPLHQISRREIAARLSEIEAEHGPNPARNARTALGSFFAWAMKEGIVEANP